MGIILVMKIIEVKSLYNDNLYEDKSIRWVLLNN